MPLQKYLENTLHGQCKLFVTRCTLAKIMGEWEKQRQREKERAKVEGKDGERQGRSRIPPRPEFLPPPTELPLRHCKHKDASGTDLGVISESHCLLDLLAGQPHGNELAKNKQHYILATADADEKESRSRGFIDVRDRARLIPGVPIVYVKRSVMILEELSGVSERVRRHGEREKFGSGLVGVKRKRDDEEDEEEDDDEQQPQGPKIRGARRAKGPNPLSVKKKKVRVRGPAQGAERGDSNGEVGTGLEGPKKRTRRGGRGRGGKKSMADSDRGGAAGQDAPLPTMIAKAEA